MFQDTFSNKQERHLRSGTVGNLLFFAHTHTGTHSAPPHTQSSLLLQQGHSQWDSRAFSLWLTGALLLCTYTQGFLRGLVVLFLLCQVQGMEPLRFEFNWCPVWGLVALGPACVEVRAGWAPSGLE